MDVRHAFALGGLFSLHAGCTCGSVGTTQGILDSGGDVVAEAMPDAPVAKHMCDEAALEKGCSAGPCRVSSSTASLPRGAFLTVAAEMPPAVLRGDTIVPILCSIAVSNGPKSVPNLTLSIAGTGAIPGNAALFEYVSPIASELVVTSRPDGQDVTGLVAAPGEYGATSTPAGWSTSGPVGLALNESGTQAELLLNLSSQQVFSAYDDGKHLLVSNGSRVLVFEGIPDNPGAAPALVLGEPDLNTLAPQTTSSLFGDSAAFSIWSNGARVVVADGNRVLVWSTFPEKSMTPADLVLGQPDFGSNDPNSGGISAASLNDAWSVDSDGTRLAVADLRNSRVVVWTTFPTTVAQPADFEIGQPDFASAGTSAGAVAIDEAWGVALDKGGGLYLSGLYGPGVVHVPSLSANNPSSDFTVLPLDTTSMSSALYTAGEIGKVPGGGFAARDVYLSRIAMLRSLPKKQADIDFVLGQPDPTRTVESLVSASVVSSLPGGPSYGFGGGTVLTVPDSNRLLVFDTAPSYNFEPASRVVGQAGFTTNGPVDYRGISLSTLAGPADVAVARETLAVADRGNNRVLLYAISKSKSNGAPATVVVGQPDATSYVPNMDQKTPSAARLSGPAGVALDGTHLIVADTENHRVLIWSKVPTSDGASADIVLGQADFTGRRPNRGRSDANGDGFSDPGADGFFYPMGVASNGTQLFVVDRMNNRILVWSAFPTTNGQAADSVVGQANFITPLANAGNGGFTFVSNGLNLPTGATLDGTHLWVSDTENNRVVRWDNVISKPAPGAAVGQASLSSVSNPNYALTSDVGFPSAPPPATNSLSVLRPRATVVLNGVLYVSEMDSNRVHMFDATSFLPLGELGQTSDTASSPDTNGTSSATLALPLGLASDGAHVWVADSGNHRVLAYDATMTPPTGASASLVLGQLSPLTSGFNQASTAADGATANPHGLATDATHVYIADTGNHRVLVMKSPVSPGDVPQLVVGQPNGTLSLPNSGGKPSASTLDGPRGVFADAEHVIVADTANHRVLVYAQGARTASLVLGQKDFGTNLPNGGGPSASTLQAPSGIFVEGTSLWVADTGNHRVLGWRHFPTSNGQAADIVLGQATFTGVLGNMGVSAASAGSMFFPTDVRVVAGALYVADSGNNRVLKYSKPPTVSGAKADGVVGQKDLTSRIAAAAPNDLSRMAGPVGLGSDQENLYVADRDLGRVLVYHLASVKSGSAAVEALGAAGGLVIAGPGGVAAQQTGLFTSRVYVSDSGLNQIDVILSVGRLLE